MYTNTSDDINTAQAYANTDRLKDTHGSQSMDLAKKASYQKQLDEATEALRIKECELNTRLQKAEEVLTKAKLDAEGIIRRATDVQEAAAKASAETALDIKARKNCFAREGE